MVMTSLILKVKRHICYQTSFKCICISFVIIYLLIQVIQYLRLFSYTTQSPETSVIRARSMNDLELTDYLAQHMSVEYKVLNNLDDTWFKAQITLTNSGNQDVVQEQWQLYFYHFRHVGKNMKEQGGWAIIEDPGVRVTHVNGALFFLEPLHQFFPWKSGTPRVIMFESPYCLISRTDLMPNWYVTAGGALPRIIEATASEDLSYVAPFTSAKQWKRDPNDSYNPYTPQQRYERNRVADMGKSTKPILPTPLKVIEGKGAVKLNSADWVIVPASELLTNEASLLADKTELKIVKEKPEKNFISLEVKQLEIQGLDQVTGETYTLSVDAEKNTVTIYGQTPAGVFYGIQTLLSVMKPSLQVAALTVIDSPRFAYRGLMLDVARNFFDKSEVMRMIDMMATYKMNHLHLHLSDDEGWRIEIPGIPELTEVGGRRGHDPSESHHIMSSLGSGPHPTGLGCGFYTEQDYKDILKHASHRHITVIPEIDMPGHSSAAIKAMRVRYHKYQESDPVRASQYLLEDLDDRSSYHSVQLFKENVINPCVESSYRFVDHVIKSLQEYHADIQPLKTFHLGGDEVPADALKQSPACAHMFKTGKEEVSSKKMKEHFVRRVIELASKHNVHIQAWEDAFYEQNNTLFDRSKLGGQGEDSITANTWITKWESGKAHRAHDMANNNYKVVLTPATHLYLDHQHEPDPEERGLYWATRFIDLRKVFNFMPNNFWANMDFDRNGQALDRKKFCEEQIKCTALNKPKNIIGMEGAIWGETIRAPSHLQEMYVLRLLALAERAWHKASWESVDNEKDRSEGQTADWTNFVNHLGYQELKSLEAQGYSYYLPLPGASLQNGEWKVNTAIPNMAVQFSVDGGSTWSDYTPSTQLPHKPPLLLATRSFNGKRRSRSIDVFQKFQ